MAINGKTTVVGILGNPVGHSRSPAMHNAAFAALDMNWVYVPLPVQPRHVEDAVKAVRALGMRGANVTVPHKQAVMPFLDTLTDAAQVIGAVNTIIVEPDGKLVGDNTDAAGFAADLKAHSVEVAGKQVFVFGAGGSARAVLYALGREGASGVTVYNRSVNRALELVNDLQKPFPSTRMRVCNDRTNLVNDAHHYSLIVNTTSLGMTPDIDSTPWDETVTMHAHQTAYDLVYNPARTRFLGYAESCGARTIGGIGMLVHQGALAFEKWTGVQPPIEVMQTALAS